MAKEDNIHMVTLPEQLAKDIDIASICLSPLVLCMVEPSSGMGEGVPPVPFHDAICKSIIIVLIDHSQQMKPSGIILR